eukprot:scaffold919_cov96-Skeletonema_dohrnii-CCMP3373.AAC.8
MTRTRPSSRQEKMCPIPAKYRPRLPNQDQGDEPDADVSDLRMMSVGPLCQVSKNKKKVKEEM